ncbi:DUF6851 domain-containing protein [Calothrix rhizosoleniae]|uniref:DUF6851 domain-containing protein n=1 Tax=Calothrix rhizosoleniae TaxID=888997 RepID=UPI001177B344|nr:calcium-binding protein [Calothrix rhizosoleniae]
MSQKSTSEINDDVQLILDPETQLVTVNDDDPTISVLWDKAVQQAVINSSPGPTIASRAYGVMHTAMFDAWAAYDPTAIGTQLGDDLQVSAAEITDANKEKAMSFAAYRVLTELFPTETAVFDELMAELGFDSANDTTDTSTAAGIGNVSAEALLEFRRLDGSSDTSDYEPVNGPSDTNFIDFWTPEPVPIDAAPGEEDRIQQFLTPQWGQVTPFALESGDQFRPEAPEPFLLVDGVVDVEAQTITLNQNTATYNSGDVLAINESLIGEIINPEFIAQAEEVVNISANLTDEQKLVAEFWEDGGGTSFPPGTWMTFGQFVSARDDNTLDEDAQLFFGLGNAVFDAGIATWEAKTFYDYARPVRAIRDLSELGLIGEFDTDLGGFVIDAWGGPGEGTQTILATDFLTYQTPGSDPSPPFAEYTSGHSAFSASAAEILKLFTGSDDFGAFITFKPGESRFEPGVTPTDAVTLEWETFSEAADEAGISRLYGGIHFTDGDLNGRTLGQEVGATVFEKTQFFINGGEPEPIEKEIIRGTRGNDVLSGTSAAEIIRGLRGDDAIYGNGGEDELFGGKGDDTIAGSGSNEFMDGGAGDDVIYGNGGEDYIAGGKGDDLIYGGSQADIIYGNNGDDTIYGNGGEDYIAGGKGDDLIYGGSQADIIYGNNGDDTIYGNGGNDYINSGRGFDTVWLGGGGSTTVVLEKGKGYDIINNFQLGSTHFQVSSLDNLSFDDSSDGAKVFQGNDLLAVVSWNNASTLSNNVDQIFSLA